MRSTIVVFDQPSVEIDLQLIDRVINLFTKGDPVELVQHGAMEALANSIWLRALGFGAAVIEILDRPVELVFMALNAAKLGAAMGQDPVLPDGGRVIKRHNPVVEDLGRGDRGFAVIELGEGHLGVGIDEGLLIDPPDALQGADIKGVLRPAIAWAFALKLTCASLSVLAFSRAA